MILYGDILPEKEELLKKLNDFRSIINTFNNDIGNIINKLNCVKDNVEKLYKKYILI